MNRWSGTKRITSVSREVSESVMTMDKQWARSAILLVIGLGSFMGAVDSAITTIIVPVIQKDFSTSVLAVQWVTLAFLVTVSGFLPVFGRLGDLWGHRTVYLSGVLVFTLSSFLCGLAPTVVWLISFRVFQAVGSAMVGSVAPTLLTMNFPPENRGRVLGLQLTMTYLGLIAGPSLGGFLTQLWHWRAAFWINVPIGMVLFLATLCVVPSGGKGRRERFDFVGAVLLFTAVAAGLLGITGSGGKTPAGLILLGMLLGFFFARRELRLESRGEPVLVRMSLFRNRIFSLSAGVSLVGYTCEFFVTFLVPFYLMQVLGLSGGAAGLLLTVKSIVMVFVAPLSGNLSDRLGPRPLSLAGMGCYAVSLIFQAQLTGHSGMIWVASLLILSGIAVGLFVSPNNSAMLGAAPQSAQGVASAVLALVRNLGMAFGIAFSGALLAFRPASVLDGFRFAMFFGTIIAAVGIVLSAFQKRLPAVLPAERRS